MSESKAFRPDGGGMSLGRIQEIADNPYCDEENGGWLKRFWQEPVKNQLHMWMLLICANSRGGSGISGNFYQYGMYRPISQSTCHS